jgi:hypothetical protein
VRVREHEEQLARRLVGIAVSGDDADSLRAIALIHDRLYGKPGQHIHHETDPLAGSRFPSTTHARCWPHCVPYPRLRSRGRTSLCCGLDRMAMRF